MPTTQTTYKRYSKPGSGDSGWGTTLNDQMIDYVDTNMGGILPVAVSSGTVTLNEAQSRNAIFRITGALLGDVTISTPTLGFFFVENLTSNNFTVSVRNTSIATAATVPQGTRATLISDATNGVRIASSSGEYQSGVSTLFFNTNAPVGWTKSTTAALNNAALRIVTSSGGGTSGSSNFTDVFAARTIAKANLPNFDVTISDPGHSHTYDKFYVAVNAGGQQVLKENDDGGYTSVSTGSQTTGITAAFGSTARPGSQTTMDFAVKYVDAIVCVKD